MRRGLLFFALCAVSIPAVLGLGWLSDGDLGSTTGSNGDGAGAHGVAAAPSPDGQVTDSEAPIVLDGHTPGGVIEHLRKPVRVAVVAEKPEAAAVTEAVAHRSFRTLGPLDTAGVEFVTNKLEGGYLGAQARLADLSARTAQGEAPDIARYAMLNEMAAMDRACFDAFRRGDYVTVAADDEVAWQYFSGSRLADCLTRFRNGQLGGRLVRLVFVLCKDRYPEYHQAIQHQAEASYFLSQEFSKRFNALPEPRRRELWAAWNDSRSALHNEAVEYFKCRLPHRLIFDEALGMVSAEPPGGAR